MRIFLACRATYVGVSRPVWVGDRLLLARRVAWNGETVVQGCWLDWPQLKTRLLAEAVDLLPEADLVPVTDDAAADPGRMLAGLPVRLVVGEAAVMAGRRADAALGVVDGLGRGACWRPLPRRRCLHGVMTLSERRAAFVSQRDARAAHAAHHVSHVCRDAGPRHGAGCRAPAGVLRHAAARGGAADAAGGERAGVCAAGARPEAAGDRARHASGDLLERIGPRLAAAGRAGRDGVRRAT